MLNLFITQSLAEKENSAASNFDRELFVRQFRDKVLLKNYDYTPVKIIFGGKKETVEYFQLVYYFRWKHSI